MALTAGSSLKAIGKILLIVSVPFLFIGVINAVSPTATFQYLPAGCSRYCEQHGCPHFAAKFKSTGEYTGKWWFRLYVLNVKLLNQIPYLNYAEANIAVYFVAYPLLIIILLYRLIQ